MILKDNLKIINGIIIQLDKNNKYELNSKELKYNISLEKSQNEESNGSFSIKNENNQQSIIMNLNKDMAKQILDKNINNNIISFLGFKHISDNQKYIYLPNGERCLFEKFCNKFSFFKINAEENNKIDQFISFNKLENNSNYTLSTNEKILKKIEVTESELRKNITFLNKIKF